MAAASVFCGAANATQIYSSSISVAASDPTQLGRLSRNGIPQDWSGGEAFPGVINTGTSYHYATFDLDLGALEAGYVYGGYIQVLFDSQPTTTFLSGYLNSYLPAAKSTNWLGDTGTSSNASYFGNPLFFQVTVSSPNHLVLLLNETSPGGGLNLPGIVTVEAYSDTQYTDLLPVPEAGTWAMMLGGLAMLSLARRKSS